MVGVGRDLCGSSGPTPCQSRVTQSRLHRTLSRRVLNISREGDSTAPLGSLGQGPITLRVKKLPKSYQKEGCLCPEQGVPAFKVVMVVGKGSPSPLAVPRWGSGGGFCVREMVLVVRGCRALTLCLEAGLRRSLTRDKVAGYGPARGLARPNNKRNCLFLQWLWPTGEPSWEGKGERAPVCEPSGRAMGEIKPGDDRREVNGLFLSPPLSLSPSLRLYSRSPRAPWLITRLRDRRGHGGGRRGCGPSVRPWWPAMPMAAPAGSLLGGCGVTTHHPSAHPGLQPSCWGLGVPGALPCWLELGQEGEAIAVTVVRWRSPWVPALVPASRHPLALGVQREQVKLPQERP